MKQTGDDVVSRLKKHVDLGHDKRNKAFLRQVAFTCASPGTHVPQAAGKAAAKMPLADAMSMYRFAGNEKIPLNDLRTIRAKVVLETLPKGSDLLVVHDMSPLDYSKHNSKKDRRPIGNHRGMGYEYIACVAINPITSTVLGVVHDTIINADGPDDSDVTDYDYEPLFAQFSTQEKLRLCENHRHQMAVHINGTASLLAGWRVIDVGDREFDDVFILDCCKQNDRDFVIRSTGNRNVQSPQYDWLPGSAATKIPRGYVLEPGHLCVNFAALLEHVPLKPYKSLPLDARSRVVEESSAKRSADLSIGSFQMRLYRDAKRNKRHYRAPHPVDVNVVIIREINPLPDCKALCWILFTSLPVDTLEQMSYVGHIYELRWKIEDFFRLMKSGYRILDSRLNNAGKIARLLVVLTLAAMSVLDLKQQVGLPSKGSMDSEDYDRVKTAMIEPDNPDIDLNMRLFAFVAKSGGWLGRRRDPIGPTILMRGMLHLLAVFDSAFQYAPLIEEARQNPQILRRLFCV